MPGAASPSTCCFPGGDEVEKRLLKKGSFLRSAVPHVCVLWEMGGDKIIPFILPAFHGSDLWGRNPPVPELLPEVPEIGAAGRACGCGFQALNDLGLDKESLGIGHGMCCDKHKEPSLVSMVTPGCV